MAAPRPLPSRFDFNLKTLNRVDQHSGHANTRQVQPYLHNIRHRGLSLDRRCWLFTDSSGASPPFQGFHPTQPTFSRRAGLFPLVDRLAVDTEPPNGHDPGLFRYWIDADRDGSDSHGGATGRPAGGPPPNFEARSAGGHYAAPDDGPWLLV